MAIQFFCSSCNQPIEVDDDYANRAVTCPYCRTSVMSPAASDESVARQMGAAHSSDTSTLDSLSMVSRVGGSAPGAATVPRGNGLGWVSLAGVSFTLVTFSIIGGFALTVFRDMDPAIQSDAAAMQKHLQQALEARPGLRTLSMLGSCVAPLIAVTCAVLSLVRRGQPRWPAITTLAIYFICLLCLAFAVFFSAAQMPGAVAP